MFKKSNAFFIGIVEGIGRLLAPHKLFWTYAFATWVVAVFVLRVLGLAPLWLFGVWLWSIPFLGAFALMAWLDHINYFDRPEVKAQRERLEQDSEAARQEQELKEALLRKADKTRPDRR